ncbi:MAG: phosphodiester glycosidase family protein [Tepidisphaeraceae bacterium]
MVRRSWMVALTCGLLSMTFAWGESAAPSSQPAEAATTEPVSIRQFTLDGPVVVSVATVDLASPRVKVVVRRATDVDPDGPGPCITKLDTVRSVASREHLAVAINGDFFTAPAVRMIFGRRVNYFVGNPAFPVGWMMVDGQLLHTSTQHPWAALIRRKNGSISIAQDCATLPDDAELAVGGSGIVVRDGRVVETNKSPDRAPRSAVGLSADGKTMWLVAVDGRRPEYSRGVTMIELGQLMKDLGAATAMNLDGGGSTTLVARSGEMYTVLNKPSDGHDLPIPLSVERPVANVLGVMVDP